MNTLTAGLKPTHPGEVLREDVLPALGRTKVEIAGLLGISRRQLYDILEETRPITPQMALRIGKLTGTTPESWLAMQQAFDLRVTAKDMGKNLKTIPAISPNLAEEGRSAPIQDGNEILKPYLPLIVKIIEETARWADPITFKKMPIWAPYIARKGEIIPKHKNRKAKSGGEKTRKETNVAAQAAFLAAIDIAVVKRPKNWTVCHVWGYDDPSFQKGSLTANPKYYSCVANMVWLPTALKGFTDAVPEIKTMLRVCAYNLYDWVCDDASVLLEAKKIESGYVPDGYPETWPRSRASRSNDDHAVFFERNVSPFSERIDLAIKRQQDKIELILGDASFPESRKESAANALDYWKNFLAMIAR